MKTTTANNDLPLLLHDHGNWVTGPIVVAVSGGADSVALLRALLEKGVGPLVVAHLDHRLRAEAGAADSEWVQELAAHHRLPFFGEQAQVGEIARNANISIEQAARQARYTFLEQVALKAEAQTVVTGHTQNDQVETILFRILRGTGLKGLSGIPVSRPIRYGSPIQLLRPLLSVSRDQVEASLLRLEQPYRTDATNTDLRYRRNQIRHELLPHIRRHCGNAVEKALLGLAEAAAQAQAAVSQIADNAETGIIESRDENKIVLFVTGLVALPDPVVGEILAHRLIPGGLDSRAVASVLGLARSARSGGSLDLRDGWQARREYGRIVLARLSKEAVLPGWRSSVPVVIDGETTLPVGRVVTRLVSATEFCLSDFLASRHQEEEAFDADMIVGLQARTRCPGDRYRPLGMTGHRKLKELLIDRKIPRSRRELMTVLTSAERVVWPVGCPIGDDFKVSRITRNVLIIKVVTDI